MFTETQATQAATNPKADGWYFAASYFGYTPQFDAGVRATVTDGELDKLFTKIQAKDRLDLLTLAITDVVVSAKYLADDASNSVEDAQLDAMLARATGTNPDEEELAPLLEGKNQRAKSPTFAWVNLELTSSKFDGPIKCSIEIKESATRSTLKQVIKASINGKYPPIAITAMKNPRIKREFKVDLDF